MNRAIVTTLLLLLACSAQVQAKAASPNSAETVLIGGKVLTLDEDSRIVTAIAVGGGRVIAVGNDNEILKLADKETTVIRLGGKTVIPGIIAAHCHAIGVARNELQQPHEELLTIGEIQDWSRRRAKTIPPGQWIRTPRADITRLNERRHPTTSELDQACTTHPVIFTAARKSAMNTLGLRTAGVKLDSPSIPGGDLVLDDEGNVLRVCIDHPNGELLEKLVRTFPMLNFSDSDACTFHYYYQVNQPIDFSRYISIAKDS